MSELPVRNEDKKLDWMYRDASQIVDREEYLLGRKIDKQFEASVLPPDKEQECLPPSIFSRGAAESQVDVARKLQEDPLYLIKKKEIECREQLLKNPRKMKQLQEMIAKQQAAAEKLAKKQMKKRKKKELDALLVKKCKKMFGGEGTRKLAELDNSDSETSSSETDGSVSKKKKKKKKKERKHLDRALALKYKKVVGNLDAKGLAEMDCSSESSSEDESEEKVRRKKKRQSSSSSDERQKRDLTTKKERETRQKYYNSEDESRLGNENKNRKREHYNVRKELSIEDRHKDGNRGRKQSRSGSKSKPRGKSSSSEDAGNVYDKKQSSKVKGHTDRERADERRFDSHHRFNYKDQYYRKTLEKEKSSRKSYGKNRLEGKEIDEREGFDSNHRKSKYSKKPRQDEARYSEEKEVSSRSSSENSIHGKNKYQKIPKKGKNQAIKKALSDSSPEVDVRAMKKSSQSSKKEISKRKKKSSTSSSSESSSDEKRQPKKQYGLVLPANYVPKKQSKEEMKPVTKKEDEPSKPYRKEKKVNLTEEEKERKLKEMMDNAKWRDEQRDKNIKAFKEKEKAEKDDYVYNEHFMRKQMAIAVSQGTVESRVKANINTIQRSGTSMSEHFARRT